MSDEHNQEPVASGAELSPRRITLSVAHHRAYAFTLAAAAAGIVLLLGVTGHRGSPWTLEDLLLRRARAASMASATTTAAPGAAVPAVVASPAPVTERVDAALARADVPEDLKLAVVEKLARDPSDPATDTLLRAAHNSSLLISMAALKALTGRRCERLERDLTALMADDEWQRRAWAVKVLGESGCTTASEALRERWRGEPDARVREQIADAMSALRATGAQ